MTNANFTFLIFFHKTPLSKGRLGYQSPFPFCKAATTLHYPYGIVNFAVTLNSKIPARVFSSESGPEGESSGGDFVFYPLQQI